MRICRFLEPRSGPHLGLVLEEEVVDLTALDQRGMADISAWLKQKDPLRHLQMIAELAERSRTRIHMRELDRKPTKLSRHLLPPIDTQEVWGAGVTYERSREVHIGESHVAGRFYEEVYDAGRPELFFKASPHRVAGPNQGLQIRSDSAWTVPEPELCVVITPLLKVVGYTCGNDMSARDIDGMNPLYLPQAKTYDGCCGLGPFITVPDEMPSMDDISISMIIIRDGMTIYQDETSTARMRRSVDDLVEYLGRDDSFPEGAVLMTGTGIVPSDEFALEPNDTVEITIAGIGTLRNTVTQKEPCI